MNLIEYFAKNEFKSLENIEVVVTYCICQSLESVNTLLPTKAMFILDKPIDDEVITDILGVIATKYNKLKNTNMTVDEIKEFIAIGELPQPLELELEQQLTKYFNLIPLALKEANSITKQRFEIKYRLKHLLKSNVSKYEIHASIFETLEEAESFYNEQSEITKNTLDSLLKLKLKEIKKNHKELVSSF